MFYRLLLDPQGGEGSGTPAQPDLATALKALLAEKHGGDATALARDLLAKNRELEADNRRYRARVKELRSGVPEEGSVVLAAEDAERWAKYRALGEPDEVKASVDSGRDAAAKLEGIGRAETFRKAAVLDGYNPEVFADLADSKGIRVEFAEETRDGKAVEVAFVRGEGDSRTPLKKFVESHLSSYLPALTQGKDSPRKRDRSEDGTPPRRPTFAPPPREDDGEDDGVGLVGRAAYAT